MHDMASHSTVSSLQTFASLTALNGKGVTTAALPCLKSESHGSHRILFHQEKPFLYTVFTELQMIMQSGVQAACSVSNQRCVTLQGQTQRHVSSTQMNKESSRSHLIMSVIIEATNLQTQNVTRGKLSFVDLAGSER